MSFNNVVVAMDLSLSASGFAVLALTDDDQPILLESSLIKTKGDSHGEKIAQIVNEVSRLVTEYIPDHLVREQSFSRFAAATQAIYKVNGAVDYILWTIAEDSGILDVVDEIAASTIKKIVGGHGKTSKEKVAEEAFRILKIENTTKYYRINRKKEHVLLDDMTDALAVGLAYYEQKKMIKI